MAINLLDLLSQSVSPGLVKSVSGHLGESGSAVESGFGALLPVLLGGLASKASTGGGAASVFSMLTGPKIDTNALGSLGSMLGGGQAGTVTGLGTTLLSSLFGGDKLGGVGAALASITGLKPGNASSLLALAAPLVFGFLKKFIGERGLDAAGTAQLLTGQKDFLANKLEPSLTAVLGLGSPAALLSGLTPAGAAGAAAAAPGLSRWLPWLLGLAAAVGLLWALFGGKPATPPVAAPVTIPVTPPVSAPAALPAPAAFDLKVPAKIYFASGKADIGAPGMAVIDSVAALLKADASKKVDLTGYTDKTGDTAANQTLAKNRAMAVQAALLAKGVAADRITGKPPVFVEVGAGGSDAEARRVEISAP